MVNKVKSLVVKIAMVNSVVFDSVDLDSMDLDSVDLVIEVVVYQNEQSGQFWVKRL